MGREEREGEREREEERQGMRYVTFCDAVAPMALWKRKSLAREDFTTSEGAHRWKETASTVSCPKAFTARGLWEDGERE